MLNLKYNTQLAFSCEMKARPGMKDESLHICTGKEVYMGDNVKFVPLLKEVTCPAEGPCVEKKQCGSESLPLKQSFIQKERGTPACAFWTQPGSPNQGRRPAGLRRRRVNIWPAGRYFSWPAFSRSRRHAGPVISFTAGAALAHKLPAIQGF